jgi:hypothetical protein
MTSRASVLPPITRPCREAQELKLLGKRNSGTITSQGQPGIEKGICFRLSWVATQLWSLQ